MNLEALLSELEAKARAATSGPWDVEIPSKSEFDEYRVHARYASTYAPSFICEEASLVNAQFISSANPSTIERLIAIIRRQQEALKTVAKCPLPVEDEEEDGDLGEEDFAQAYELIVIQAREDLADVERIAGGV